MAGKGKEETPQQHHDAHENEDRKRNALPGVFCFVLFLNLGSLHFLLLIQSIAAEALLPFPPFSYGRVCMRRAERSMEQAKPRLHIVRGREIWTLG